jgi:hypothetical protein
MIDTQFQLMTGKNTFDILPTKVCAPLPSGKFHRVAVGSVPVFGDTTHRAADTSLQVITVKGFSLADWSFQFVQQTTV